METIAKKKYYSEITLLKGWCMLLAVIGHSLPDAVKGFHIAGENSVSEFMYYWIYSFHMATFFACAGFLMIPNLLSSPIATKTLLNKRFMRLMIPYFFYSLLYYVLKSLWGGEYADNPLSNNALLGILLGDSPCYGAWFLWTLFIISCISLILRRVPIVWLLFLSLLVSIACHIFSTASLPVGITRVMYNMIWFALGGAIGAYYTRLSNVSIPCFLMLAGLGTLTLLQLFPFHLSSQFGLLLPYLKTMTGMIGSWGLAMWIKPLTTSIVHKLFDVIGKYCMDVYMLSMYVLVPMRIIYVNFGVMKYINYYVWVGFAATTGILLPILVSKYVVRKNVVLKKLLVGG